MDISVSDYIFGGYAVVLILCELRALKRNNYKPIYKEIVKTACYVAVAMTAINDGFNNGTALGFLASAGISFIVASIGLTVAETVISFHATSSRAPNHAAAIDKSVRWVVIAIIVMYMINIAYDGFILAGGTRIDLVIADTLGLCLSLFCIEKARLQMRTTGTTLTADTI